MLILLAGLASLGVDIADHIIAMQKWRQRWPDR